MLADRAAFPRDKACGEYLSPGAVDALERLGALPAISAADAAWLAGMQVSTARASFLINYGRAERRPALGIRRAVLDALLVEHAQRAGARVAERVHVRGAALEGERVVGVHVRDGDRVSLVRAHVTVAADGARSPVARSLRLDAPVRWPRRLGIVAHYAATSRDADHGVMEVGKHGYCGIAPVGERVVAAGLVTPLRAKRRGESTAAFFERQLATIPRAAEALAGMKRVTGFRGVAPLARRVRSVAGPGYLLVGDAAGFLDPFTGEGLFRALRGAELAADATERALERRDALPVGYAAERAAAFEEKERVCVLVQTFLASGPLFDYPLRRLAPPPPLAALFSDVLGDCAPARLALRPRYLAALLRP